MKNPEMQAINILLEERMPENVVITKEKKEKINKIKYNNLDVYSEKVISKVNTNILLKQAPTVFKCTFLI